MPRRKNIKVLKESGLTEDFDRHKVFDSLVSAGAGADVAEEIIEQVIRSVTPPFTTRKIYRTAKKFLRRHNAACTMKYSLKEAIYALGPSGYPFEKYIGKLLHKDGYDVAVGRFILGDCVRHELDVLARKDNHCYMVECKFHQSRKTTSDVKTALYVHARFLDIIKSKKFCGSKNTVNEGMIVTNTRFTSEAIKYAECVGIKTMGWKYPRESSLELTIERDRSYPVTILPGTNKAIRHALLENDIVLASDLLDRSVREIARLTGLKHDVISKLREQSEQICC